MSRRSAKQAFDRAEVLIGLRRPQDAVDLLRAALASDPEDPTLLAQLSRAFLRAGEPASALAAAEQAVSRAPGLSWGHRLRSRAWLQLAQGVAPAEAAAREAVRLDPYDSQAWAALADAQLVLNRLDQARRSVSEALRLEPEGQFESLVAARVEMAALELDAAEVHVRRLLAVHPDDVDALITLGMVMWRAGSHSEALDLLKRAVRLDPRSRAPRLAVFHASLLAGTLLRESSRRPTVRELGWLASVAFAAGHQFTGGWLLVQRSWLSVQEWLPPDLASIDRALSSVEEATSVDPRTAVHEPTDADASRWGEFAAGIELFEWAAWAGGEAFRIDEWCRWRLRAAWLAGDRHGPDRTADAARALVHAERAAELVDKARSPALWVSIQRRRAIFLPWTRDAGQKEVGESVVILREVVDEMARHRLFVDAASAKVSLGRTLGQLDGDRAALLTEGIHLIGEAQHLPEFPAEAKLWAQIHLGQMYLARARERWGPADAEAAVEALEQAARGLQESGAYLNWGTAINSLAGTLFILPAGSHAANVERALTRLHECQRSEELAPRLRMGVHAMLSVGLRARVRGDRRENRERAFVAVREALTLVEGDEVPDNLRHALGLAYLDRSGGDRRENVEKAVAALTTVHREEERRGSSVGILSVGEDLGRALRECGGPRLDESVAFLRSILDAYPSSTAPRLWTRTLVELGRGYRAQARRAEGGPARRTAQLALDSHLEALSMFERSQEPWYWMDLHEDLAEDWIGLRGWDPRAATNAEEALRAVLDVLERDEDPGRYDRLVSRVGELRSGTA